MKVRFSARSEIDLQEIGDYIAQRSPMQAVTFIRTLRKACNQIGLMPTAYRERPELGAGIRSSAVKRHVIFFVITGGGVLIVRVLHGARDIGPTDLDDDQRGAPGG